MYVFFRTFIVDTGRKVVLGSKKELNTVKMLLRKKGRQELKHKLKKFYLIIPTNRIQKYVLTIIICLPELFTNPLSIYLR